MILDYELSEIADKDLIAIFKFSIQNFGRKIAIDYKDGMIHLFEQLIDFPDEGKSRIELLIDLRSIVYKSHIIFYRVDKNTIMIERILHQSLDVSEKFKN